MQQVALPSSSGITVDPFQLACINHLSRLEHHLEAFRRRKERRPSVEKTEVAKELLVELIDFAEAHFAPTKFEQTKVGILEVYKQTKDVEQRIQKDSWAGAKRLLGLGDQNRDELAQQYQELRDQYLSLIAEFFRACVADFADEDGRESVTEGGRLFVRELKKVW